MSAARAYRIRVDQLDAGFGQVRKIVGSIGIADRNQNYKRRLLMMPL